MIRLACLRTLLALVLMGGLAAGAPVGAQVGAPVGGEGAVGFVGGMEDLPLMAGLTEISGAGMVFDTPAGRIVEAFASGAVSRARVVAFYAATLPQLGWRQDAETLFKREGELLMLEFPQPAAAGPVTAPVTVRFVLSPQTAAAKPR